jgi:AcrR family transcriptional regulator
VLLFRLVAGLRERKKAATRAAIRDAAMALFAEHGFAATTIDRIAEAADVSRATVFSYYPSKEDIVFGDASLAIEALAATLRERTDGESAFTVVRGWLGQLQGWIEPELVLQLRLVREVPVVAARRLQHYGDIERVIADALQDDLGPGRELAARLAAASLLAALRIAEESAAAHMEQEDRALTASEIAALLDDAVTFARAGIAAVTAA